MLAARAQARNRATPTPRIRLIAAVLMTAALVVVATAGAIPASPEPVQTTAPTIVIHSGRPGTWEIRPVREAHPSTSA